MGIKCLCYAYYQDPELLTGAAAIGEHANLHLEKAEFLEG
jgi:hypothetical protein